MSVVYIPAGAVTDRFHISNSFVRGLMGPMGSGKSVACCMDIAMRALEQLPSPIDGIKRTRAVAIRQSYPELKSTTIETWLHWFPEKVFGKMRWDAPIRHKIKLAKNCELDMWFLALERPDDVKKLLGCEATIIWLNEARELPKEVLDMSTIRVGRYPDASKWSGIIMDTNPPSDDHWWYRLAEEEKPEGFEFFRQPSALGPLAENLNNLNQTIETKQLPLDHPDRIARGRHYYLRTVAGKSNDWVKVNVEAQYGNVQGGRPVYPEFNDAIHVASTPLLPNRALPLLLGFDFGMSPACAITQVTPRGQWIILDEVTSFDAKEGQGLVQFIDGQLKPLLAVKYPGYKIISLHDPAGVQRSQADEVTCRQILKQKGLNPSTVGTNNFTARREAVAGFLSRLVGGEPAFLMSPSCKILRKGMNGDYGFKRVQVPGEDRYKDMPDKSKSSHVCEAVQYIGLHIARPLQHDSKPRPSRMQRYVPASVAGY